MIRIIIAGSRGFDDYRKMCQALDEAGIHLLRTLDDIEIVSGHAKGADALGEKFAKAFNIPLKVFPADWNRFGKAAGPIRNEKMARYASEADRGILFAFPIGKSRGTRNMIATARRYGIEVYILDEDPEG